MCTPPDPLTLGVHTRSRDPSHPDPVLPSSSTLVAHSTPPDPGPPVASHSLAPIASWGRPAPTRAARTVTCKDHPPGIPSPRMSGPPTDATRAALTGLPRDCDAPAPAHVHQPDSSARPPPACMASVRPAPARSAGTDPACPVAARLLPALSARPVPTRPGNSKLTHPAHAGSASFRPTTARPTRGRPTHDRTSVGSPRHITRHSQPLAGLWGSIASARH